MTTDLQTVQLDRCLSAVWRRAQWVSLSRGALTSAGWAVALFVIGFLIDWMLSVPAAGRSAMLLAILGVSLYKAWQAGWRDLRRFDAARAALQIEEHHGGMESLLISAVQFRDTATVSAEDGGLSAVTCQRAEIAAGAVKVRDIADLLSLRQPALWAAVAVVALVGIAISYGPMLKVGAARIFAPWLAIEYPTRTQVELVSGDMVVQEGKPLRIAANILGLVPANAQITLRTGNGRARLSDLPILDGACEYQIDTVFRDFDYRITAGDARSAWHTVRVVYPPNIEQARVTLNYPPYTRRAPQTVEALTITIPETTRIAWVLSLDQAVRQANIHLAGHEALPMDISTDGRTVSFELAAADSRSYSFSWVEREHGYVFDSPSYYMQVAPDRPPRIELTSPRRNLYATLGRRLDLTCRAHDDHGIAEASVIYRVDKLEEQKAGFPPPQAGGAGEHAVDWDYRTALPDVAEGQSVAFAVEAVDRYPGANGPHRARSESRRIQFVSREDYLVHIERQKRRLLGRLRTNYREQRQVHELVLKLDPTAPEFAQNCQLEAVRQDLMRERLSKLADRMHELTEDLTANGITDEPITGSLMQLRDDIRRIASDHVTVAAEALRTLASQTAHEGAMGLVSITPAADRVDDAARELGLLVLQLGYEDASEVMAREMHAAAQDQAALRLQTIMASNELPQLAEAQLRLGEWLTRLFKASPSGRETTVDEALVEFTLTRMIKQVVNSGIRNKIDRAVTLMREGRAPGDAARLQEQVIAALLRAEFRLRVGAEREALSQAMGLFRRQAEQQKKLRAEVAELEDRDLASRRAVLARAQAELQQNLQLLLMPEIPAARPHLFDDVLPSAPPVSDLLAAADQAMVRAGAALEQSNRAAAVREQGKAEQAFASLGHIADQRIARLTEAVRIERRSYGAQEIDEKLELFGERQLGLLERTEDAAADNTSAKYLADQQKTLADAVDELRLQVVRATGAAGPVEGSRPLPMRIQQAERSMRQAEALLAKGQPDQAVARQETAEAALRASRELLAEQKAHLSSYAAMLAAAKTSTAPSPYVNEIEQEQSDLLEITRKAKPDELPALAVPQKNLVHAVDAILIALDPISHLVETGTVMLFAKEDMDSAGLALSEKDLVEALDAQQFIVQTLQDLRARIDVVVPQYPYLLEIVEALHEAIDEGVRIREAQRQLRQSMFAPAHDATVIAQQQQALVECMRAYAQLIHEIAGPRYRPSAASHMAAAHELLAKPDRDGAAGRMVVAERTMLAETGKLLTLMNRLTLVLAPGEPGKPVPSELALLRDVLSLAAQQKMVYRQAVAAPPDQFADCEPKLWVFEKACAGFIERARQHKPPVSDAEGEHAPTEPASLDLKLAEAKGHLAQAAQAAQASNRDAAIAGQKRAAESLRHFIADYAVLFVQPPAGPSDNPPAPTEDFNETEDAMQLFMPGAVTGQRPPDGRLEWQVLGKRDRAALNENFARELPLEFRAILKNYYERLAQ